MREQQQLLNAGLDFDAEAGLMTVSPRVALAAVEQEQMLARLEEMREGLAWAVSITEVKELRDGAEVIRAWARQRDSSLEMQNGAAELKLRAERRLGELLAVTVRHEGGRPRGNGDTMQPFSTLADHGVSKEQSSRWQQIAAVPEERFDGYIEAQKAGGEEITTADMLRLAASPNSGGTLLSRVQAGPEGSDHFQTPPERLLPLLPFLARDWRIWECAEGEGLLTRALGGHGWSVTGSDILTGRDFLSWEPDAWDCIITNPPYSLKDAFIERCYALGKPFALFLPLTALGEQKRLALYRRHGVQLVLPHERTNFLTPSGGGSGSWFFSAWFLGFFNLTRDLNFWEPDK